MIPLSKKAIVAAGFSVLFAAILFFFLARPKRGGREEESGPRIAAVKREDMADVLKLRGTITAAKKVPILSETSGQIIKLYVHQGEMVQKGAPLLEIDPTQLNNKVERQKLSVEKTEVTLKNMEKENDRAEALFKESFIPESKLNEARKSRDLAKLDYELAKKELDALTDQLKKVKITAPITGVVTAKNAEEGEVVSSVSEGNSSKVLLIITDATEKNIEVMAGDVERSLLKIDQPVEFWLDAQPGTRHQGKIARIDAAATRQDAGAGGAGGSQFRVEIAILGPQENFTLGSGANIEIIQQEAKGVVTVPVEAVFKEGEKRFVYRVKSFGGPEKRTVTTGISAANAIEIKDGLKEGERVLLDEPDS